MALIGNNDIFRYSSLEDEIVAASQVTIIAVIVAVIVLRRRRRRRGRFGGSVPGKKPIREIGRDAAGNRLDKDYFGRSFTSTAQTTTDSNEEFETRFRMPRCIYENIKLLFFLSAQTFSSKDRMPSAKWMQQLIRKLRQL
jgi:hypothetical protein